MSDNLLEFKSKRKVQIAEDMAAARAIMQAIVILKPYANYEGIKRVLHLLSEM